MAHWMWAESPPLGLYFSSSLWLSRALLKREALSDGLFSCLFFSGNDGSQPSYFLNDWTFLSKRGRVISLSKLGELDIRIFLDLKQESHVSLPVNTHQKYLKAKGNRGCCKPYCSKGGAGEKCEPTLPLCLHDFHHKFPGNGSLEPFLFAMAIPASSGDVISHMAS